MVSFVYVPNHKSFMLSPQVGAANQLMKDDVDGQMNQGNISSKVRFPQMDL
jgi:hypothetical protein